MQRRRSIRMVTWQFEPVNKSSKWRARWCVGGSAIKIQLWPSGFWITSRVRTTPTECRKEWRCESFPTSWKKVYALVLTIWLSLLGSAVTLMHGQGEMATKLAFMSKPSTIYWSFMPQMKVLRRLRPGSEGFGRWLSSPGYSMQMQFFSKQSRA